MKEDVPSTVAGFYYQAILACKEISAIAQNDKESDSTAVGIEQGADVKIKKANGEHTSIEAKFYGDNFEWNSKSITHTIYNFYKNSFNDNELIFRTNVNIEDDTNLGIKFSLKNWDKIDNKDIEKYIDYIHFCLVKDVVEKAKTKKKGEINDTPYEKFLAYKNSTNKENQKYILKLVEDCRNGKYILQDYIELPLKPKNEEIQFIKKFAFVFSNTSVIDKLKTINDLKQEIRNNIKEADERKEIILNVLIDKFLYTTVDFKLITKADYQDICKNAKESDKKLINRNEIQEIIKAIENDENSFILSLNDYTEPQDNKKEILTLFRYIKI